MDDEDVTPDGRIVIYMSTGACFTFDFSEIMGWSYDEQCIRVGKGEDDEGRVQTIMLPWAQIEHVVHFSNSVEVSEALTAKKMAEQAERYANGECGHEECVFSEPSSTWFCMECGATW